MTNYIDVTNYIMHVQPDQRIFIDFDNARFGNPKYIISKKYLVVDVNDEDIFFQAETKETRAFIKAYFGIIIDES